MGALAKLGRASANQPYLTLCLSEVLTENLPFIKKSYQLLSKVIFCSHSHYTLLYTEITTIDQEPL